MESLGWGPYQADHEDGNGQFEINWSALNPKLHTIVLNLQTRVLAFCFLVCGKGAQRAELKTLDRQAQAETLRSKAQTLKLQSSSPGLQT